MRFGQGRRLLASLGRGWGRGRPQAPEVMAKKPDTRPIRSQLMVGDVFGRPRLLKPVMGGDVFGRPRPSKQVMDMIELTKRLSDGEKTKFGYIFSELLGLPKPRKRKSKGEKFAVKLVKYDPEKRWAVLRAVAWVKCTETVIRDISEMGLKPSLECVDNVPYSLIKKDVTKEEADEIITKIEVAGGVAVMEPMK